PPGGGGRRAGQRRRGTRPGQAGGPSGAVAGTASPVPGGCGPGPCAAAGGRLGRRHARRCGADRPGGDPGIPEGPGTHRGPRAHGRGPGGPWSPGAAAPGDPQLATISLRVAVLLETTARCLLTFGLSPHKSCGDETRRTSVEAPDRYQRMTFIAAGGPEAVVDFETKAAKID